eukprot:scaffold2232_cov136-Skeletonema_menzelii.AAC.2
MVALSSNIIALSSILLLLLSGSGLSSAFQQSAPALPLSTKARHKSSLQQPQPTWINDAPSLQRNSKESSFLFSSSIINNDNEQIDDDNASSPTLRKRDKIRLLIKSISNFILRLQSRLDTTKTIGFSLLLSWLVGSLVMDHSGLQIIRRPVQKTPAIESVAFSQFMNYCEQTGRQQRQFTRSSNIIEKVKVDTATKKLEYKIQSNDKRGVTSSHAASTTDIIAQTDYSVMDKSDLVQFMRRNNVDFEAGPITGGSTTATSTTQKSTDGMATLALLFAAYKLFYSQSSSSSPLSMLSSKDSIGKLAKKKKSSSPSSSDGTASFDDIYGIDNAKHDVMELVDSLRYPQKYQLVGARAPRGILLEGPPGCGKTTLARACANLADVPLIYCSGSDFVETYVGKGAARIRQLFAQARSVTKGSSSSSCLIFIDEIDAIGKARRSGGSSGNIGNGSSDEAEQTLNALLTQMDGLGEKDSGIFVLAATNRRELLDPALVRSGRFDRLIKVELPNARGRYEILRSHARKLPGFEEGVGIDTDRQNSLGVGKTIDLNAVAAVTGGCSGADLEQIVNEAAIRTVRRVGAQLKDGVSTAEVDVTILPEDMEESVESFFQSRIKPQRRSPLNLNPWSK